MDELENKNLTQPLPETETQTQEQETMQMNDAVLNESDVSTLAKGVMQERNIAAVTKKQTVGKVFVQIGLYTFLGIMAIIVLFPFLWMISASLKSYNEYYDKNLELVLFPEGPRQFSNYATALKGENLGRYFLNTLVVGIASTCMSLVITVLSAFALSRLDFKGKNALFAALLATMMIPGELFTITNLQTVYSFGWNLQFGANGWINAFLDLTIPFLVSVFYIYLLKQNFMQIPNELYLAAKVDGTSDLKYLWKVMIPLALPTLISITILKMMGAWNTYMWPQLTITNDEFSLITMALRKIGAEDAKPDVPVQMAAVTLVSIPLFLVFIFLRKYIMKGVSRSGIKG